MAELYPKRDVFGSPTSDFLGPICQGLMKKSRTDAFQAKSACSTHGLNAGHLWNVCSEIPFNAHLQGHGAGWTTNAGAVETDLNHAFWCDVDKFEVSAVGLDCRADEIDDFGDLVAKRGRVRGVFGDAQMPRGGLEPPTSGL